MNGTIWRIQFVENRFIVNFAENKRRWYHALCRMRQMKLTSKQYRMTYATVLCGQNRMDLQQFPRCSVKNKLIGAKCCCTFSGRASEQCQATSTLFGCHQSSEWYVRCQLWRILVCVAHPSGFFRPTTPENSKSYSHKVHLVFNEIVNSLAVVTNLKWENYFLSFLWVRQTFCHLFSCHFAWCRISERL